MINIKQTAETLCEVANDLPFEQTFNDARYWLIIASIELEEVARVRDAALADLYLSANGKVTACEICRYNGGVRCTYPDRAMCGIEGVNNWKWRGVCAENGGTE